MTAKRRERLPATGRRLGFEPVTVAYGSLGHSWVCNGLETHCAQTLGILPNSMGLVESLQDAERCCEEIERPETGSEPELWVPLGLVEA